MNKTNHHELTYGIIGCGMMGREHIRNIALLDGAHVGAVFDPEETLARQGSDLAGGAKVYPSLRDLVSNVDAAVIASPNHMHIDQMMEIATIEHIPLLCEKPLYTREDDAQRIADFASRYMAPLWVAMEYRYMPPITTFIERVHAATGGIEMLTIREHRFPFLPKVGNWNRFNRMSGGTMVEKCCHFFDLMCLIMQSEPVRIMASGGQAVNHLGETYMGEVPDIWDHSYVIVEFASGKRAMLELSMFAEGAEYQEEICAIGREGKIEVFVPGPTRFWPSELVPPPVAKLVTSPRSPKGPDTEEIHVDPTLLEAGDHNGATFYQHQKFLEAIRNRAPIEVGLEDGARAVRMGLAAQKSVLKSMIVDL